MGGGSSADAGGSKQGSGSGGPFHRGGAMGPVLMVRPTEDADTRHELLRVTAFSLEEPLKALVSLGAGPKHTGRPPRPAHPPLTVHPHPPYAPTWNRRGAGTPSRTHLWTGRSRSGSSERGTGGTRSARTTTADRSRLDSRRRPSPVPDEPRGHPEPAAHTWAVKGQAAGLGGCLRAGHRWARGRAQVTPWHRHTGL